MPVVGDIIRCVKSNKIGERLLVKEVSDGGMFSCEVIDTGLFDGETSLGDMISIADCDIKEFCIVEER